MKRALALEPWGPRATDARCVRRVPWCGSVELHLHGYRLACAGLDLSEHGMRLQSQWVPYVGQAVELRIALFGRVLSVTATVRWIRPDGTWAVEFEEMADHTWHRIADFIRSTEHDTSEVVVSLCPTEVPFDDTVEVTGFRRESTIPELPTWTPIRTGETVALPCLEDRPTLQRREFLSMASL